VPESPLWATGAALTCDVQAVIQHELNQGTTNFDFNVDFLPITAVGGGKGQTPASGKPYAQHGAKRAKQ
jgi:hypothetical protein